MGSNWFGGRLQSYRKTGLEERKLGNQRKNGKRGKKKEKMEKAKSLLGQKA